MKLNKGQENCVDGCSKHLRKSHKQVMEYSGAAGTGKTEVIKEIARRSRLDIEEEILFLAYTGRAAANISLRGLPGRSMHSALMNAVEIPKLDDNGNEMYKHGRKLTTLTFRPKAYLPRQVKALFIDEGSFVDTEMGNVALSFGLPIIVAGDLDQLGPIYGDSFFLHDPDYILTEIMRQKNHYGIIDLATRIRLGGEMPTKPCQFGDDCFILRKKDITDTILVNSEMILCSKNKTRNYYNDRVRHDIFGITSKLPVRGDKVIVRKNDWNRLLDGTPLTNGTSGYIHSNIHRDEIDIKSGTVLVDFRPDYSPYDYYAKLPIDIDFFLGKCGEKEVNRFNKGIKMELASATTIHLAQGSQATSVLYDDTDVWGDSDTIRRLRYTAVTRSTDLLIYVI